MVKRQRDFKVVAEILKGVVLCILLFPVGVIFLVLGTITGLAELFLRKLDKFKICG